MICATLRKLGWEGELEITQHGLTQNNISKNNKFIRIANIQKIKIEGLNVPASTFSDYWKYEQNGEKIGTIFVHLVVENFTKGFSIYENHAGCERGYFMTKDGEAKTVKKYIDHEKYKAGDKSQIVHIPDLVVADTERLEIINVEGNCLETMQENM